jgi:O-antigen/teichoic acid export membrane protein
MSLARSILPNALQSAMLHVAPRIASALVFIAIGRVAGPAQAGVFTLAITYLIISTTLLRGLDDLTVREVARDPDSSARYLANFLVLRFILAAVSYGVLWLVVRFGLRYPVATAEVILILALSQIPESLLYTLQALLMGRGDFRTPTVAWLCISALRLGAGIVLVQVGAHLTVLAWTWNLTLLPGLLLLLAVALRQVGRLRLRDWLDYSALRQHWRAAVSFLAINVLLTVESQSDTVLLSLYRNEQDVSWYGAATTVTMSLLLFSQAYRMAVYPAVVRYALHAPQKLAQLYERSVRYLGSLGLPMVVGLVLLAQPIVLAVFGPGFAPSIAPLAILAPALLFMYLNAIDVRILYAHDRQTVSTLILGISVLINLTLNLTLDGPLGATGAAVARVSSSGAMFLLCHVYVTRNLLPVSLPHVLARSAVAALLMGVLLRLIPIGPLPLTIVLAAIAYLGLLLLLGGVPREDRELVLGAARRVSGAVLTSRHP